MQYMSTRGTAPVLGFEDCVLAGLASDGGLYLPERIPQFSREEIAAFANLNYEDLAFQVIRPFVGDELAEDELKAMIRESYSGFAHKAVAPLQQIDHNLWILELFHGPTLAFKDFALQFLGRLFDNILTRRQQKVVIMGATSGDTGSAAIEGCRHSDNVEIFILHPHERVSEVQRRQMTTVQAGNVHNIALQGNFDDCQNMVKASFADQSFLPQDRQLAAVNSINWARIMAQIVYYFYSAVALGAPHRAVSFSVPTGNFGDIFAGYIARKMGLPIERLVIATNQNDILHRCISDNDYSKQILCESLSPSMDIMISSNFERMLYDLEGQNAAYIAELMGHFNQTGALHLSEQALEQAQTLFASHRLDDDQVVAAIRQCYQHSGYLMDPHTAIGVEAGVLHRRAQTPMVCLATAHPAKFPAAVDQAATGTEAALPAHMQDLYQRQERYQVLPNNIAEVQSYIRASLSA